jgi:glyoxylase-like metal-dependent hydrolase (beta-lactamase superfamily II)
MMCPLPNPLSITPKRCSRTNQHLVDLSPDASLTQDDSFTATNHKGLTYILGDYAPGLGSIKRIADGISWARIPMPGSLGHINCWLLDDHDGMAIVDTGMLLNLCSDAWKALFEGALKDVRITRIICTHLHPDHIGLAGWLCHRFGVELWMTRGEWLTARMLTNGKEEGVPEDYITMQRAAGWDETALAEMRSGGWGRFARMVYQMPVSYRRMQDGDVLDMGVHKWRVVVGSGHSPEHACLLNDASSVLVSGDQVLPRISSNVSVNVSEPEADPLGEWLSSIDKLLQLSDDLIVCPAHGEPFKGLHTRLAALRDEHLARLDAVVAAATRAPLRVIDCFPLLFNRAITGENRELATGEAISHVRRLELEGRLYREERDGVRWYNAGVKPAGPDLGSAPS